MQPPELRDKVCFYVLYYMVESDAFIFHRYILLTRSLRSGVIYSLTQTWLQNSYTPYTSLSLSLSLSWYYEAIRRFFGVQFATGDFNNDNRMQL